MRFGFFGFLDLDLALHSGQIGALRCICWWHERHAFIGGGCCLQNPVNEDEMKKKLVEEGHRLRMKTEKIK